MLDVTSELDTVRRALHDAGIDYALCGGLAMGVHGYPRATVDIDLLVQEDDLTRVYEAVAPLGFTVRAHPMDFSGGAMKIRRVSKIDRADGDTLMLDLLLVTDGTRQPWQTRETRTWRGAPLSVVSKDGLIALKSFRNSKQDLADMARLRGEE